MRFHKSSGPKIFIFLILAAGAAAGCCHFCKEEIVAIKPQAYVEESYLPLDAAEIDSTIEFIKNGGMHKAGRVDASPEEEPFRSFLQLFTADSFRVCRTFAALPAVKKFISPHKPVKDVVDARDDGAQTEKWSAFRLQDFWFVFVVDSIQVNGRPILRDSLKFNRLIVMPATHREQRDK